MIFIGWTYKWSLQQQQQQRVANEWTNERYETSCLALKKFELNSYIVFDCYFISSLSSNKYNINLVLFVVLYIY